MTVQSEISFLDHGEELIMETKGVLDLLASSLIDAVI